MKRAQTFLALILTGLLAGVCTSVAAPPHSGGTPTSLAGIHKIQHVIVVMQENRSFDSYFGTYPGADGLPATEGQFTVCIPDPATGSCVKPYHDPSDVNYGGPHGASNASADVNGGRMDGFIAEALKGQKTVCATPDDPRCGGNGRSGGSDVMGYHDAREIPNYWAYAQNYVLQDHMYEPNASWSLPEHLFMVSEWSATCSRIDDPQSCVNELQSPQQTGGKKAGGKQAGTMAEDLRQHLLDTWAIHARTVLFVLAAVEPAALAIGTTLKGRSAGKQFASGRRARTARGIAEVRRRSHSGQGRTDQRSRGVERGHRRVGPRADSKRAASSVSSLIRPPLSDIWLPMSPSIRATSACA